MKLYNAFFGAQSHDGSKQRYFICSAPMKWTGKGVEVEFVENRQKCPRRRFTLTPFCSDNRRRTYFPVPRGEGGKAGVDELITNI